MPRRKEGPRQTQEERSNAMRVRLLDAAMDCLVEHGYAGTTTVEVAKRAGVSRGAQLHHFPTREELVTAAMKHCHDRRIAEYRSLFKSLPPDSDPIAAGIDLLWSMFQGRDFYAFLELDVAARTDPILRRALESVAAAFTQEAAATVRELFPAQGNLAQLITLTLSMSFFLMEGMALERIVDDNEHLHAQVLGLWKTMLARAVESHSDGVSNGRSNEELRDVEA